MNTKIVLFGQALETAVDKVKQARGISHEITLVRDLRGQLRILLPGNGDDYKDEKETEIISLCGELSQSLGNYGFPPERMVLFIDELAITTSPTFSDRQSIYREEGLEIFLLDRQITGQDWLKGS